MDWLTDHKLELGKYSKWAFDWMKANLKPLFDFLGGVMEGLINAILWLLQTPHPLVIVAFFVALTWVLQRNWRVAAFVALAFMFILNQGYWEETTESLTLVLSSCGKKKPVFTPRLRSHCTSDAASTFEA